VSKKKKKRRRRPPQAAEAAAEIAAPSEEPERDAGEGARDRQGERRERPSADRGGTVAIPIQPPLLPSLGRGFLAVGRSPSVLVTAFIGLLALWLLFSTTGAIPAIRPGAMGQLLSVPPLHSALLDSNLLNVAVRVFPPAATLGLMAAIVGLRAGLTSYWLAVTQARLTKEPSADGTRQDPRSRAVWAFRSILGLEALFLAVLVGLPVVLAQFLGIIGLLAAVIGATYFLVYAPAVAMTEGTSLRETLRLSARAARARGPQHTWFVFAYILAVLTLVTLAFAGRDTPATPSLVVWLYALAATFVHLGVQATFLDRWLSLRDDVKAYVAARPTPARARATASRQ
jgi:hypothetical protein